MMNCTRDSRAGITLVELVVVLIILILSAVLIVPLLQRSCGRTDCMFKAKAIAGAVRCYASSWDGWTNSDRGYYVKLMGYKLNSEEGYFGEAPPWYDPSSPSPSQSQQYAATIRTFRCPQDSSTALIVHGVPSSYQVSPLFVGVDLAYKQVGIAVDRLLVVAEVGQRHPAGMDQEGRRVLDGHYVYADLHSALGYSGQLWRMGLPAATKD